MFQAVKDKLLKKVGVGAYVHDTKIEMYELVLSNFPRNAYIRDVNSDPPDLDTLPLNLLDQSVKSCYYLHYNRWFNILNYSRHTRMPAIRNMVRQFFNSYELFCRYVAMLFVHLSNIIHNVSPDLIDWEDEDDVVNALRELYIRDNYELNACRCLYRLPSTS